jgi:L-serine deaminase
MNDLKMIEDIVATLSEEEREQHRELIAECLKREEETMEASETLRNNMDRLTTIMGDIVEGLSSLYECTNSLEKETKDIQETSLENILSALPDEKFFNA